MFQSLLNALSILGLVAASSRAILDERASAVVNCTNGGTPLCCQGTFAGDLPSVIALAELTSYPLNPNDINCIGGGSDSAGSGHLIMLTTLKLLALQAHHVPVSTPVARSQISW